MNPHLKTCSKCKRDQPIDQFVRSPRYLDGHGSHCKTCRREYLERLLASRLICCQCKSEPHAKGIVYCERCKRLIDGRTETPKFRRDSSNTLCSKCKTEPRKKHDRYCSNCRNAYNSTWMKQHGGMWKHQISKGHHDRVLARAAVNRNKRRGKIQGHSCEVCGDTKSEAHHHKGYSPEHALDVRWLCKRHHDEAERVEKSLLTEQPLLL